jgi:hypothetical protein
MQTITTTRKKLMIVVWRWHKSVIGEQNYHDHFEVENTPKTHLFIPVKESHSDKKQLLEKLLQKYADHDVMLFFHDKSEYQPPRDLPDEVFDPRSHRTVQVFTFGGGSEFIYLSQNEYGILGTPGRLWHSQESRPDRCSKAGDAEDYACKVIKKAHFESVWNYYPNQWKAKTDKFYHRLNRYLADFTSPDGDTPIAAKHLLNHWRQQKDALIKDQLDSLLGNGDSEALKKQDDAGPWKLSFKHLEMDIINYKDAKQPYANLQSYLRQLKENKLTKPLEAFRTDLQTRFEALIEALPGEIFLR